jgi:hypothetical protein
MKDEREGKPYRRLGVFLAPICSLFLTADCYTYQPLRAPVPATGQEIRGTMLTTRSVRLGEITLDGVDRIEGIVQSAHGDSVVVSADWVYTQRGSRYSANGGILPLDRTALRSLEVRRLSPARTGLAAVLAVGVTALLFRAVDRVLGGSRPPPGGGDGN